MADFFLRDFGGSRQAGNARDTDCRVVASFRDKPDKPAAEQGANRRNRQRANAENQNDADFRVKDGLRFAQRTEQEAEEQRCGISQGGFKQFLEWFDLRFFNGNAKEEGEDQRRGDRQQQAQ